MPLIKSSYQPTPFWLRNAHLNTINPAVFRTVKGVTYEREVLEIEDGDFLDLDWWRPTTIANDRSPLVIALHGLEGSTDRPYVTGICRYFGRQGWHCLGLNQRTCGGRMNRLPRAYHMGTTDDVARVVKYAISLGYQRIALVGFSMGGNHVLKYIGEEGPQVPNEVIGGVAFSVPCHIASANVEIDKWHNRLYLKRFLRGLNEKMRLKAERFPNLFDVTSPMPKNFQEFDDRFTGPMHGFTGAMDYWTKCSSRQFIPTIQRPTLLVNALDDTFLSEQCYPRDEASNMDQFYLETPRFGGHVGFGAQWRGDYWSEQRAFAFLDHL
ncbi:MAG: alpha/beta fold hydrolase [Bacteroidota bacterium]